jgi:hypothetical protein
VASLSLIDEELDLGELDFQAVLLAAVQALPPVQVLPAPLATPPLTAADITLTRWPGQLTAESNSQLSVPNSAPLPLAPFDSRCTTAAAQASETAIDLELSDTTQTFSQPIPQPIDQTTTPITAGSLLKPPVATPVITQPAIVAFAPPADPRSEALAADPAATPLAQPTSPEFDLTGRLPTAGLITRDASKAQLIDLPHGATTVARSSLQTPPANTFTPASAEATWHARPTNEHQLELDPLQVRPDPNEALAGSPGASRLEPLTGFRIHAAHPASPASQLAEAVSSRLDVIERSGQTEFRLRLEPPELGSMRVHLRVTDDTVATHIVVQEELARQAIDRSLQELRNRLSELGFNVGRCHVACDGGGGSQEQASERMLESDPSPWKPTRFSVASTAQPMPSAAVASNGRLDVVV